MASQSKVSSKMTYASALLALAVAHASFAATVVINTGGDYSNQVSVLPSLSAGTLSSTFSTASLVGQVAGVNGQYVLEPQTSSSEQVFYWSAPNSSATVGTAIGPTGTAPGLAGGSYTSSAGSSFPSFKAVGSSGAVLGQVTRYNGAASVGIDAWLYLPANTPGNSTSSPITVIINDHGILATPAPTGTLQKDANGNGIAFYENTTTTTGVLTRSTTPVAINNANQVIGTALRYNGGGSAASLGSDAFIYDPSAPEGSSVTIIGLRTGSNASTSTQFQTGVGSVPYAVITNTPVALNSTGAVVGTAVRYQSATSTSTAGQDVWLYSASGGPVTNGGTVQLGLVNKTSATPAGGYYAVAMGTTTAYTLESSAVVGVSSLGTVAGTSQVYNGNVGTGTNNATAPSTLGQDAWLYTPSATLTGGTNATAPDFTTSTGNGTYTQLGLTTPGTATIGYSNATGYRSTSITAFSTTGNAAGVTSRLLSTSANASTTLGQDPWFYSASTGVVPIVVTPTAVNSVFYSNYVGGTPGNISTNISRSSTVVMNNGTMASGNVIVGGTQERYSPTTGLDLGQDAYAYIASTNTSYVIASPALLANLSSFSAFTPYTSFFNSEEYFTATVKGITDAGLVYGYFTPYAATSNISAAQIGSYIFTWTLTGGTNILTANNIASATSIIDPLSNPSFIANIANASFLSADASGNIYSGGSRQVAILYQPTGLANGAGVWTNAAHDNTWTTNNATISNWSSALPNGASQTATFNDSAFYGTGVIDLNSNKTIGNLVINTASAGYTFGLPGTTSVLIFQGGTGDATVGITGAGSHTINAPVKLSSTTDFTIAAGASMNAVDTISGSFGLSLAGPGKLTLSASNTYTGGTTITGGTLLVSNTTGSAAGTGNITLNGGTLGGSGTISGAISAGSGAHTIAPSSTLSGSTVATLTAGSLTTNANTTLAFKLVSPGISDAINLTGTNGLNLSGGTLAINNVAGNTGIPSLGYYKVMQYAGTLQGSIASVTLPAIANNIAYTLDANHDAGFIDVHRGFLGDANDNGSVTVADYTALDNGFLFNLPASWANGDFTGDGVINYQDYAAIDAGLLYQTNNGPLAQSEISQHAAQFGAPYLAALQAEVAAVPEPTSLGLFAVGALALVRRRRSN